jgi:DNA repair protein RadC
MSGLGSGRSGAPRIVVRTRAVTLHLTGRPTRETAGCADDAAEVARGLIGDQVSEVMLVLHMDARQGVIDFSEVARGGINRSGVTPRDVFLPALAVNACSIVLAHNHPSGSVQPGEADRRCTASLWWAGYYLGVPLLDHVIVCRESHFSFRAAGFFRQLEADGGRCLSCGEALRPVG